MMILRMILQQASPAADFMFIIVCLLCYLYVTLLLEKGVFQENVRMFCIVQLKQRPT